MASAMQTSLKDLLLTLLRGTLNVFQTSVSHKNCIGDPLDTGVREANNLECRIHNGIPGCRVYATIVKTADPLRIIVLESILIVMQSHCDKVNKGYLNATIIWIDLATRTVVRPAVPIVPYLLGSVRGEPHMKQGFEGYDGSWNSGEGIESCRNGLGFGQLFGLEKDILIFVFARPVQPAFMDPSGSGARSRSEQSLTPQVLSVKLG